MADLVNSKVVASSSIMNVFDTFATVTYEPNIPQVGWLVLSVSHSHSNGMCVYTCTLLQIRSDWYVYMVLSAIPWVCHVDIDFLVW